MEKEHLTKLAPAPLGDEERRLAHECVDSRVCGLSPRGDASNGDASTSSWELTHSGFTADRPNLTEPIDQI